MPSDTDEQIDNLIVYGIVPRSCGPDGCRSVAAKLDDLQALGVNAIWLSPVNVSPPGDFGYAVIDYFKLRPEFGTEADFSELVQKAHRLGIRVFMDIVPNHTSAQHPYFVDVQAQGMASSYFSYYDRDEAGQPTHYFNWTHLPNLNFDNPEVERWMLDVFAFWVREFDVDGFRVDAAWGIKERKPDFWQKCSDELHQIKQNVFLLAEASARDSYYVTHGFDAAYDWTDELGHWAWEHVFEDETQLVSRLHTALTQAGHGALQPDRVFRFLNNNDTGERFVARYGLNMTRVATALLLTLPGIPCIYMGDEVGAEWHPYQTSTPISWDDQHDLRPYHHKLVGLRHQYASLRSPHWLPVKVDGAKSLYAYVRYDDAVQEPVLCVLNFGNDTQEAVISLPPEFAAIHRSAALYDILADETIPVGSAGMLHISIPAYSARVLVEYVV